jgi:mannose-6-phosphate isomerase-like protein (cupin superfamily)
MDGGVSMPRTGFHGDLATWTGRLPTPDGKPFVVAHEHGTLSVELYAPRGVDAQAPHGRDEVYVVVRGEGLFVNGPDRHRFGPGDLLFVPAGVEHRIEEFTDDRLVEQGGDPSGPSPESGAVTGALRVSRSASRS